MTGTREHTELYDTWVDVGALENTKVFTPETYGTYLIDEVPVTIWTDMQKLQQELLEIAPEGCTVITSTAVQRICKAENIRL